MDANIIISALIHPAGKEASLIFDYAHIVDFAAPDFIYNEILPKRNKIIAGSHHTENTLDESLQLIIDKISVFSVEKYETAVLNFAAVLTFSIDKKDTQYIALTIFLEGLLWTGDLKLLRGLKRKGFTHIITTLDFVQIIKGL